jgi:hypothetical protein
LRDLLSGVAKPENEVPIDLMRQVVGRTLIITGGKDLTTSCPERGHGSGIRIAAEEPGVPGEVVVEEVVQGGKDRLFDRGHGNRPQLAAIPNGLNASLHARPVDPFPPHRHPPQMGQVPIIKTATSLLTTPL